MIVKYNFYRIFFFYLASLTFFYSKLIDKPNSKDDAINIFTANMYYYIMRFSNLTIIDKYFFRDSKCFMEASKPSADSGDSLIYNLVASNGNSQSDDGFEEECVITNKLAHLFITYKLNSSIHYGGDEKFNNLFTFLENDTFFTSLCLMRNCLNLYMAGFNQKSNKIFFNKIEKDFGIYDVKLFNINYLDHNGVSIRSQQMYLEDQKMLIFIIICWILFFYIIFRIIITFLSYFLYGGIFYNQYDLDQSCEYSNRSKILQIGSDSMVYKSNENILSNTNMLLKSADESIFRDGLYYSSSFRRSSINESDEIYFYQMMPFPQKITNSPNQQTNFLNNSPKTKNIPKFKNGIFYKISKIFSFKKSFKIIFSSKSKFYDDTNLEILRGIKFFILFLLTLNQSLRDLEKLPHRYLSGYSFYSSICFFIVKYTTYGVTSFIMLNGIYLGYKLMSYFKKNENQFNLKEMLNFIFKLTPYFFTFIFSFLFLHLFIKQIGYYLMNNLTVFHYFVSKNIYTKQCFKQPYSIFMPLFLNYFTKENDHSFTNCLGFVYLIISEFYCMIIFIFIFYILNKIKNKKIDLCFFIFNFINLLVCYFLYDNINNKNEYYSISRVMGEVYTIQKPYLYFFPYFLGINIGIMWFYYKDMATSNPLSIRPDVYNPFVYNFYIMKFFDKKRNKFKMLLVKFTTLLIILLGFSFNLIIWINKKCNCISDVLVEYNPSIRFLFIYEGKIYLLLSSIFIVCLLFYNKESYLKNILSSNLFSSVNKISFTFYCTNDFIVYLFYSTYNVHIYNNILNEVLFSWTLFICIVLFSCICVILIEIPLRIILRISRKS